MLAHDGRDRLSEGFTDAGDLSKPDALVRSDLESLHSEALDDLFGARGADARDEPAREEPFDAFDRRWKDRRIAAHAEAHAVARMLLKAAVERKRLPRSNAREPSYAGKMRARPRAVAPLKDNHSERGVVALVDRLDGDGLKRLLAIAAQRCLITIDSRLLWRSLERPVWR